jgi:hypothetical protein
MYYSRLNNRPKAIDLYPGAFHYYRDRRLFLRLSKRIIEPRGSTAEDFLLPLNSVKEKKSIRFSKHHDEERFYMFRVGWYSISKAPQLKFFQGRCLQSLVTQQVFNLVTGRPDGWYAFKSLYL